MKTTQPIVYHPAGWPAPVATIPAGTRCRPARNLPNRPGLYWADGWRGMSPQARAWSRSYGFLLTREEIRAAV